MSIAAPETEHADCLCSRQMVLSSPRRIRSSVHCPVASSSSVLSRTYGHHSVVGICLMSLFTYLAILSRFLVRLAVGKHCGWNSETATPSRFLWVGFV